MGNDEILISLWKETRNTINHLDKMMDGVRVRIFTLFGTITSIAAALYFWAPEVFVSNIRLSVVVELVMVLVVIPSFIQNRIYHFWLFRAIRTALFLENLLFKKLKQSVETKEIMITYSLTKMETLPVGYWRTMFHSSLFWMEIGIFGFIIATCVILSYVFLFPLPN